MNKIIKFIRDNQTNEKEFFFLLFNKNCDNLFDMNIFYNKLKNYIKDLNKEEENEIFNIIDVNKQKKISYKQVMNFYIQEAGIRIACLTNMPCGDYYIESLFLL